MLHRCSPSKLVACACVCARVCACACVRVCVCVCICIPSIQGGLHVYVCMYVHACMYVYVAPWQLSRASLNVCMHMHVCVCVCTCLPSSIYIHIYTYIHIWKLSIYIHTYTYIQQACSGASKLSYMCFLSAGINTPGSPVGFTQGTENNNAKKTSLREQGNVAAVSTADVQFQENVDALNKEQARLNRARYVCMCACMYVCVWWLSALRMCSFRRMSTL